MFKQIAALLRPKQPIIVAATDSVEFPVKRKSATRKSSSVLVSKNPIAKKSTRKKTKPEA